jgi:hypothetical protein
VLQLVTCELFVAHAGALLSVKEVVLDIAASIYINIAIHCSYFLPNASVTFINILSSQKENVSR